MDTNYPPTTWRELLGKLTERPAERQRVAGALDVSTFTITRWVEGKAEPRIHNLKRLPEVFPVHQGQFTELIQAELAPNIPSLHMSAVDRPEHEVGSEYFARVLSTYATVSGPFRAWSIRNVISQQAIEQLDPDLTGLEITLVQCVTPAKREQPIRSLYQRMGTGSAPRESGSEWRLLFMGAESLPGWTFRQGEPAVVQDTQLKQWPLPMRSDLHYEQSAVAWPLQREGKLAGCLLVCSTQKDYFSQARLSLIEIYANMMALSFYDEEFYALNRIALEEMPLPSQQQESISIAHFRERIARLRREHRSPLSEVEAEVLALQEIEAEFLNASNNNSEA
jgi:hypothetical protein